MMYSFAPTAIVASPPGTYPWLLLAACFMFATVISVFALLLGYRERSHAGFRTRKLFSAFVLGGGIHLSRQLLMLGSGTPDW